MGKHIGVLMGGWGEERDISLQTGNAVMRVLEARGHRVTGILAGPGVERILRQTGIDVALLALHGRMGEDGRMQGLLEVMGIPYTGSGVLASALAMNKPAAKELFRFHNLEVAAGYVVTQAQLGMLEALHGDLGFPCVVKPAHGGSSVGLSVVTELEGLALACRRALALDHQALVERWIPGREVTVGILDGEVLGTCEVELPRPESALDFQLKYRSAGANPDRYHLPPRLAPTRVANVERLALGAYRALGCRGHARVDLRVSDEGNETLLEVNTLPGLTSVSLLPRIARHVGVDFPVLVERILASASLDDPPAVMATPSFSARSTRGVDSTSTVDGDRLQALGGQPVF